MLLPQAIAGAMWADPGTYTQIPLHVAATGAVDAVSVRIDDLPAVAATPGSGTWVASIELGGLALGVDRRLERADPARVDRADRRGRAGTNAVIVWIDERHGGSILDPKPEVFLETVWR